MLLIIEIGSSSCCVAKTSAQKVLRLNYEVSLMDCTYKTNAYRMPLCIVITSRCQHRQVIQSNPGASSLDRPSIPQPLVADPAVKSNLDILTLMIEEICSVAVALPVGKERFLRSPTDAHSQRGKINDTGIAQTTQLLTSSTQISQPSGGVGWKRVRERGN